VARSYLYDEALLASRRRLLLGEPPNRRSRPRDKVKKIRSVYLGVYARYSLIEVLADRIRHE